MQAPERQSRSETWEGGRTGFGLLPLICESKHDKCLLSAISSFVIGVTTCITELWGRLKDP